MTQNALELLGAVLGLVTAVLLHEGGHALAGLASGMSVTQAIFGPFRAYGAGRGVRAGRQRPTFAGAAVVLAPSSPQRARGELLVAIAAGPLASASAAVAALAARHDLPGVAGRSMLASFLMACGLASAVITVLAVLPQRMKGVRSDGGQVLDLWRMSRAAAEAVGAARILAARGAGGLRPREYPRDALAVALHAAPGTGEAAFALVLALVAAVDRRDEREARALLARAEAELAGLSDTPASRGGLLVAMAWCHAALLRDAAAATSLLAAAAELPPVNPLLRAGAEAAVAALEGRTLPAGERARLTTAVRDAMDRGLARAVAEATAPEVERAPVGAQGAAGVSAAS